MDILLSNRQLAILEILQKKQQISVEELAEMFSVTPTSIRRDLVIMDEKKLISRTRGFAYISNNQAVSSIEIRRQIMAKEKAAIAKEAMKFLLPNDSVILDSGTSVLAMANELLKENRRYSNVSIVTNSLPVASLLSESFNIIVTGGYIDRMSLAMLGPEAERSLERIAVNKAFMGTTGLQLQTGLTAKSQMQMSIKQRMIEKSLSVYVLMDAYKFSSTGANVFCSFDRVTKIITVRNQYSEEKIKILKSKGINIHDIVLDESLQHADMHIMREE